MIISLLGFSHPVLELCRHASSATALGMHFTNAMDGIAPSRIGDYHDDGSASSNATRNRGSNYQNTISKVYLSVFRVIIIYFIFTIQAIFLRFLFLH